ncbi:Leucine Rich Repeat [Glugoides intestinalis]
MAALRKQPVKSSENQTTTNEEKDLIRIFRENYKSILRFLYSYKKYKRHYKPAFDEPHANKDKAYIMFHKSSEYIKDEIALKYMKELLQIVVLYVPRNIDLDIIRFMKNIKRLYIDGIKELEKIPDLLFDGLTNLELLSFQNNNIKELQPNIFEKLQKLEYLYLTSNKLTELPSCVFDGLVNLKSLWLEDNNIKELQPNIFNNLQKLEEVYLTSNKLTEFPSCVFDGLVNLKSLWLQNNNIKELQPNIFEKLQKLEYLYLTKNKLAEFPSCVFDGLVNLKSLYLSENEINSFPIGSFTGLTNLNLLSLSHNKLREIPPSILSLTNLESLDISSNNLTSVPKEIGNMSKLRYLYLNSNSITEISSEIKSLKKLYILDLKGNPLAENGSQGFMGKRELIEHFRDRVVFETEEKMETYRLLKEELYARLEKEPIHWNRERLKELRLSSVPTRTLSDEDILKIWTTDLRQYCNDTYENETNLIKKIDSYLNVLFTREEIPDGLQREYSIIKDLFEYIFKTLKEMIETDSNGVRSYVTVLAHRMCFCPTGKIEGLEHMYSILSGSVFDNNLIGFIEHQVAAYKDIILTETVAIKNPQNVHIINHWRNKMKEELGLVVEYKEKILPISLDKFGDSDGNMLEAFYKRFNPQFIIDKLKESINEEHKWVIESAGLLIEKEEVFEKCFDFEDDVIEDELTNNLVKNIKAEGVEEILLDLKILKTVNTDNSTQ